MMKKGHIFLLYLYGDGCLFKWLWVAAIRIIGVAVFFVFFAAFLRQGFSIADLLRDVRGHLSPTLLAVAAPMVMVWFFLVPIGFAFWRNVKTKRYCRENQLTHEEFFMKDKETILKIWAI